MQKKMPDSPVPSKKEAALDALVATITDPEKKKCHRDRVKAIFGDTSSNLLAKTIRSLAVLLELGDELKGIAIHHATKLKYWNGEGTTRHQANKFHTAFFEKASGFYASVEGSEQPKHLGALELLGTQTYFCGLVAENRVRHRSNAVTNTPSPESLHKSSLAAKLEDEDGKLAESEARYRKIIIEREKWFGKADPETISAYNNLGNNLIWQKRFPEAKKYHRTALLRSKKVFGKNDDNAYDARNNYAMAMSGLGDLATAEKMFRAVIKRRETQNDENSALMARNNLATVLIKQEKFIEAEKEARAAYEWQVRILKKDNLTTLKSQVNMATALSGQGRYPEAEKEFCTALELLEQQKNDRVTLSCRRHLAECLHAHGKQEAGLAVEGYKKLEGEDHFDTRRAKTLHDQFSKA